MYVCVRACACVHACQESVKKTWMEREERGESVVGSTVLSPGSGS